MRIIIDNGDGKWGFGEEWIQSVKGMPIFVVILVMSQSEDVDRIAPVTN